MGSLREDMGRSFLHPTDRLSRESRPVDVRDDIALANIKHGLLVLSEPSHSFKLCSLVGLCHFSMTDFILNALERKLQLMWLGFLLVGKFLLASPRVD
jgi:hypothetical protein